MTDDVWKGPASSVPLWGSYVSSDIFRLFSYGSGNEAAGRLEDFVITVFPEVPQEIKVIMLNTRTHMKKMNKHIFRLNLSPLKRYLHLIKVILSLS